MQIAAKKFGAFDLFNANWMLEESTQLFCAEIEGICVDFIKYFADANPAVDNMARLGVFLKDFPAGSGYQNIVYYAQDVDYSNWKRFNYGEEDNVMKYGTFEPPLVPIQDLSIPVGLFSGSYDELADPTDVANLAQQLGSNVVYNQQFPLGHLSFGLALDMSWFTEDAVDLIKAYSTTSFLQ